MNTKELIIELLGTDDFGAPPSLLYIKFISDDLVYEVSVPYSNNTYVNLTCAKSGRF